jgi:hypothetical protein
VGSSAKSRLKARVFPQPIPFGDVERLHFLELKQQVRSFPDVAAFTLMVGDDSALTFDVTLARRDVTRGLRQMLDEHRPVHGLCDPAVHQRSFRRPQQLQR